MAAMKAKTAGLLRVIGPVLLMIGIYVAYTVIIAVNQGSIHWGAVMGLKPLITREHEPDQFQILMIFLGFDALVAMAGGIAMSYFGFFRKPEDQ